MQLIRKRMKPLTVPLINGEAVAYHTINQFYTLIPVVVLDYFPKRLVANKHVFHSFTF